LRGPYGKENKEEKESKENQKNKEAEALEMRLFSLLILVLLFGCVQVSPPEAVSDGGDGPTTLPTVPEEGPPAGEEPEATEPAQPPAEGPALESEEITYKSLGWNIHGTLYESINDEPTKVIMLLPMLGQTRSSYPQNLIEDIHESVPDAMVLAIDTRGHGESTNLGTWQNFDMAQYKDMRNDVLSAKSYFASKHPTVKEYYVVGASIGSTAAILAGAQDSDIVKIAMLSPGMEYKGVNIERAADDYQKRLLIVAASGDSYSANSAMEINDLSPSQKVLKIYGGSAHGTGLFDATEDDLEPLSDVLIDFLKW
jgi:pimeloyl-ACP methyl ester carboxylesterase